MWCKEIRKAARTTYVLKRNRQLLHGRNNTKTNKIPAWGRQGGKNKGTKRETRQKEQNKQASNTCHCYRFRAPPIELNENKQKLPLDPYYILRSNTVILIFISTCPAVQSSTYYMYRRIACWPPFTVAVAFDSAFAVTFTVRTWWFGDYLVG